MAVYSGNNANNADLIARPGISKTEVEQIYDEICPIVIGQLKFESGFENLTGKGLARTAGVWYWNNTQYFDGWVYPDGSSFSSADFPEAAAVFGKGGASFSVPDLRNCFFRGSSSEMASVGQKTELFKHAHSLTNERGTDVDIQIKKGFVFCATNDWGSARMQTYYTHPQPTDVPSKVGTLPTENSLAYSVPTLHAGATEYTASPDQLPLPFDITLKLSDLSALFENGYTKSPTLDESYPAGVSPGDFIPESVYIPTMIYIGKKYA